MPPELWGVVRVEGEQLKTGQYGADAIRKIRRIVSSRARFRRAWIWKLAKQKSRARTGLNPKTQQKIKIPAKTVVKFRVAKAEKDSILGAEEVVSRVAVLSIKFFRGIDSRECGTFRGRGDPRVVLILTSVSSQVEQADQANDNEIDCHDIVQEARNAEGEGRYAITIGESPRWRV